MLNLIIESKKKEVEKLKIKYSISQLKNEAKINDISFINRINNYRFNYLLEIKKASPSKGLIRKNFEIIQIIENYKLHASAISVLTDEKYFLGSYKNIAIVRSKCDLPILHKDFIIDPIQIYLGRLYGSSIILLMLSTLTDSKYIELFNIAKSIKLDVITEVSNEQEAKRALQLPTEIIGINNRNLTNLTIDLGKTKELSKYFSDDKVKISESGIYSVKDTKKLSKYSKNYLIGSSIMAQENINKAVKKIIFGKNKVCGLTNIEDAINADNAGAYYGGLIFYSRSKRNISKHEAYKIKNSTNLNLVGVFVNAQIILVASLASDIGLSAIQLHGDESEEYIFKLKKMLPTKVEIWKAYSIDKKLPIFSKSCDKLLLDTALKGKRGGTGRQFDWNLIKNIKSDKKIILAGGINIKNIKQALKLPIHGLDLNSGIEKEAGKKDKEKIETAFKIIRDNYPQE